MKRTRKWSAAWVGALGMCAVGEAWGRTPPEPDMLITSRHMTSVVENSVEVDVDATVSVAVSATHTQTPGTDPREIRSVFGRVEIPNPFTTAAVPSWLSPIHQPIEEGNPSAGEFHMPRLESGFVFARLMPSSTGQADYAVAQALRAMQGLPERGGENFFNALPELDRRALGARIKQLEERVLVKAELPFGSPPPTPPAPGGAGQAAAMPRPWFPFLLTRMVRGSAEGTDILALTYKTGSGAALVEHVVIFNINGPNTSIELDDPNVIGDQVVVLDFGDYAHYQRPVGASAPTHVKLSYLTDPVMLAFVTRLTAIGHKGLQLVP